MGVKGGSFLLEKGSDPYTVIGGFRSQSISINGEGVDVTNINNSDSWRRLMADGGVRTISFSGSGIIDSTAAQKAFVTDVIAQTVDAYRVTVPGIGTFTGDFQARSSELSGDKNAEGQISVTVESAGEITFTAET